MHSPVPAKMEEYDLSGQETDAIKSVAAQGNLTTVQNMIDGNNVTSAAVRLMFRLVSYHGHIEIIKWLHSRGVDVNATNEEGDTALLDAVHGAQLEATKLLIQHGADLHARCLGCASALHSAVWGGDVPNTAATLEVIDLLLEKGLYIELRDEDGRTVLHDASAYGLVDLMDGLIARGANVNATTQSDETPLHCACWSGRLEAVHRLVSHGPEINAVAKRELTPLVCTCSNGPLEVVKYLVSRGAEINAHEGGCRGLGRAAAKGHVDICDFLLDNGAKSLPLAGNNPEPEFLSAAQSGVSNIVELLIDRGFSSQGPKSLLRASVRHSPGVVAQLIDHGVSLDVKNRKRQTPLHLAVLSKRIETQTPGGVLRTRNGVIQLLIERVWMSMRWIPMAKLHLTLLQGRAILMRSSLYSEGPRISSETGTRLTEQMEVLSSNRQQSSSSL